MIIMILEHAENAVERCGKLTRNASKGVNAEPEDRKGIAKAIYCAMPSRPFRN